MSEEMRKKFEAWASSKGFGLDMLNGNYWSPTVNAMWTGWKASRDHSPAYEGLVELLNEVAAMLHGDPYGAEGVEGYRLAMPDELRGFALMLTDDIS